MTTRRHLLAALGAVPIGFVLRDPGARADAPVYAEDGIAIDGTDPVSYFTEGRPVAGLPEHETHRGVARPGASCRKRTGRPSRRIPRRHAPQYGGWCAWAVAEGYTASTVPDAWRIVDGKLYLNFSRGVQRRWERDIPGNIARGDANWPGCARLARGALGPRSRICYTFFKRPENLPISTSEASVRNTGVSLHCPSFRDLRPSFASGAFFVKGVRRERAHALRRRDAEAHPDLREDDCGRWRVDEPGQAELLRGALSRAEGLPGDPGEPGPRGRDALRGDGAGAAFGHRCGGRHGRHLPPLGARWADRRRGARGPSPG
jgi:hypothetical protein